MLLTRSPLEHPQAGLSVRLACVKHAASVRPEPGSNSPSNAYNQTPKRSHSQQRENLNPKRAKLTHSKSNRTSHHGGDQTSGTTPNKQQFGTDYRYAVEFSKNGHTPSVLSRTPPGQSPNHVTDTSGRFQIARACRPVDRRSVLRHLRSPNRGFVGRRRDVCSGPSSTVRFPESVDYFTSNPSSSQMCCVADGFIPIRGR